jgi:SAM-dependent methyltransferase
MSLIAKGPIVKNLKIHTYRPPWWSIACLLLVSICGCGTLFICNTCQFYCGAPPLFRIMGQKFIVSASEGITMITLISPNDEMFQGGNREHYFHVGKSALECIHLALQSARKTNVKSVLDLPCGHGRVLRILRDEFPEAEINACDLNRDGVDFCAKTFGAIPIYSSNDLKEISLKQYDLIWCGSLLTHMDQLKWYGFLNLFRDHLVPGGVLVCTTHGRWPAQRIQTEECLYGLTAAQQIIKDYKKNGFGFRPYDWAETQKLPYGISITQPWKAIQIIEEISDLSIIVYQERGWDDHQDVIAAKRT